MLVIYVSSFLAMPTMQQDHWHKRNLHQTVPTLYAMALNTLLAKAGEQQDEQHQKHHVMFACLFSDFYEYWNIFLDSFQCDIKNV